MYARAGDVCDFGSFYVGAARVPFLDRAATSTTAQRCGVVCAIFLQHTPIPDVYNDDMVDFNDDTEASVRAHIVALGNDAGAPVSDHRLDVFLCAVASWLRQNRGANIVEHLDILYVQRRHLFPDYACAKQNMHLCSSVYDSCACTDGVFKHAHTGAEHEMARTMWCALNDAIGGQLLKHLDRTHARVTRVLAKEARCRRNLRRRDAMIHILLRQHRHDVVKLKRRLSNYGDLRRRIVEHSGDLSYPSDRDAATVAKRLATANESSSESESE